MNTIVKSYNCILFIKQLIYAALAHVLSSCLAILILSFSLHDIRAGSYLLKSASIPVVFRPQLGKHNNSRAKKLDEIAKEKDLKD